MVCIYPKYAVIDCGDAGTPGDGRRAGSTSTTFGSEVTYSCNDGFALRGSETRECQSSGSWSGSLPSCERVDCGDPGRVTNGDRVLGLTTFRSQVVYYCNRGYLLDSGSTRTCQADGEWSGSLPSCVGRCRLQSFILLVSVYNLTPPM